MDKYIFNSIIALTDIKCKEQGNMLHVLNFLHLSICC